MVFIAIPRYYLSAKDPFMSLAITNHRLTEPRSAYFSKPICIKKLYRSLLVPGEESLSPVQVKEMVALVAQSCLDKKEMDAQVDFLSKTLSSKLLEEAICLNSLGFSNVEEEAKNFSQAAIHYLKLIQPTQKKWIRNPVRSPVHSFFVALESFLKSLGLIDLFKPVISTQDVETKGQQMVLLSTLFSTLTTTFIPLMGPMAGGVAIGGIFLSLVLLSATYSFWRPLPNYLPKIENWTEKYATGVLETRDIRRGLLDQIIEGLKFSKQDHLQVMLIGKPGVGKTELVKTLVQTIENGDYPEFKGYQVFHINTADLLSNTDWVPKAQSILSFISDSIEGHRNKIIFVFDQLHRACQPQPKSYLSDQLNTMFDRAKDYFPHVIGVATENDFRELSQEYASFSGRFRCIPVTDTNSEETLHILRHTLLKISPETLIEDQTLKALLSKASEAYGPNAPMPKTAVRVLSQCIQRASKDQKTNLGIEVESLQRRLEILYREQALENCRDPLFYGGSMQIRVLKKELDEKEAQLAIEKIDISRLFQQRLLLLEAKKSTYELSLKVTTGCGEKEKNAFLIFSRLLCPLLETDLRTKASLLGVKVMIDEPLVDQVIAEEKQNQKKLGIDASRDLKPKEEKRPEASSSWSRYFRKQAS